MTKLSAIRSEHDDITQKLNAPGSVQGKEIGRLAQRKKELECVLEVADRCEKLRQTITELQHIIAHEEDADMIEIAENELPEVEQQHKETKQELHRMLLPRDPHAGKDVMVEIRAGAGGDEASLFARDLFVMYTRYAEQRGWKSHLVSESRSDIGGYKEVVFELSGQGVYGELKHERGVHRIQRIPETEKSGRIHTSTASVAVLPKAEAIDVEICPEDIKIDTYRAGGHGGQKVQKTDSAVRITHIPTGVVSQCQNERSQQQNKENALEVLRSRILAEQIENQQQQSSEERRVQIGSGSRSEKIRTYNIPQDRITDHRIKKTWHGIEQTFAGELHEIISTLHEEEERRLLEATDDA